MITYGQTEGYSNTTNIAVLRKCAVQKREWITTVETIGSGSELLEIHQLFRIFRYIGIEMCRAPYTDRKRRNV